MKLVSITRMFVATYFWFLITILCDFFTVMTREQLLHFHIAYQQQLPSTLLFVVVFEESIDQNGVTEQSFIFLKVLGIYSPRCWYL